ncbi:MAG TPA: elongation factor P, partial [Anaerolineaceae bacterium]|nr:elongation factor P [Anaerolineaceae bacterium]
DVNDLRKGVTFELDNTLYKVLEYSHHKPGRGNATIKIKARNLRSGTTLEKTFTSGDRVKEANLEYHNAQFLYNDGDLFYLMDNETFEQYPISKDIIGDSAEFLAENMEVKLTFYGSEALDVELPNTVDLEVVQADMAIRGDTATGVTKRVTVSTGATVETPQFVEVGDVIRIDTRTGQYVTRVQ